MHLTKARVRRWVLCVAGLLCSQVAAAQERSANAWRELTLADVEAAYGILARNHPAASPVAQDSAFRAALQKARADADARAKQVTTYEGWLATLRAFAVAFDDPHISLQTRLTPGTVRWPGFVVARRGDTTIVSSRDTTDANTPAVGARLVSCDGTRTDEYSRTRVGVFRGTWDVPSQRVRNTPFLLIDDGNPFLPPARACVVSEEGIERSITLRWRTTQVTSLQQRLRDASPVGAAGFGVRKVNDGWWIGVQSLSDAVQGVLDSVSAHLNEIRSAPWVVVDVRGNGGGNSEWGRRLAALLMGDARTDAATRAGDRAMGRSLCGVSWRASADVEETLSSYVRDFGPRLGEAYVGQLRQEIDSVKVARAQGRDLAPAPRACPQATQTAAGSLPPSLMRGRLVLLTDHACFSSCLLMTPLFRTAGALHVGEGTDFSTRYMEVRGFPLPSGLANFATLQKASFGMPARLGPFEPEVPFPGRIDDTGALEAWIPRVLSGAR